VNEHDPSQGVDPNKQALIIIDSGPPTSRVNPLPPVVTTPSFIVTWSGQDDASGSGVASHDIYVSDNGGPFTPWLTRSTETSATYNGVVGHSYGFYSLATDNVGNREGPKTAAEASTLVSTSGVSVQSVIVNDGSAQRSMVKSLTVTFNGVVTLDAGAFELLRQGGGAVSLSVTTSVVNGKTVAVISFSGTGIIGGSLADGQYTLITHGDHVHDGQGQTMAGDRQDSFFRLFGDSNGKGYVDNHDLFLFRSAFGRHVGEAGYLWYFDYNDDGVVDDADLEQFFLRYGGGF
jgi:hypothetical protein